jgi:hypothetical protein
MCVDFGSDVTQYNEKVAEFLEELKKRYPRNDVETLRSIAEQRMAPYFFQTKEAERPY